MSSQDVMIRSRLAHLRDLRAEIARLKEENSRLRDEVSSVKAHLSLTAVAVEDVCSLPAGGKMVLVDGWNAILGAGKTARSRNELAGRWKAYLAERPADFVWIVFDGPKENAVNEGRLRISYTGGIGPHRADRFICDYLRALKYLGYAGGVEVVSDDRDLLGEVARIVGRAAVGQK